MNLKAIHWGHPVLFTMWVIFVVGAVAFRGVLEQPVSALTPIETVGVIIYFMAVAGLPLGIAFHISEWVFEKTHYGGNHER